MNLTKSPFQVISANRLLEGDLVYLTAEGSWTPYLNQAALAKDEVQSKALLAKADQPDRVVGPYLLQVEKRADGTLKPSHFRERFRELGPSNRPDLGRQAEGLSQQGL